MKLPHLVFYVDNLPSGFAGVANGPVIRILKSHKYDDGLHDHEYEHVRQWYLTLGLHGVFYLVSRKYRMWSEAKAYAKQTKDDLSDLDTMAYRMSLPVYKLGITQDQAKLEIMRHL